MTRDHLDLLLKKLFPRAVAISIDHFGNYGSSDIAIFSVELRGGKPGTARRFDHHIACFNNGALTWRRTI